MYLHISVITIILTGLVLFSPLALAASSEEALSSLEIQLLGQKYMSEPTDVRVSRLENMLNLSSLPKSTLDYRLSRLFSIKQVEISSAAKRQAIALYNHGIDETNRRNYEKAVQYYEAAIRLHAGFSEAYNNLGNLLEKLHQYEKALEIYQKALEQTPDRLLLHRNIGIVYEKLGNVKSALVHYREYLSLAENPDPTIARIVRYHDEQLHFTQNEPDYFSAANTGNQGQTLIWAKDNNPIPVYIDIASDQIPFTPAIREALSTWEKASHGRIKFKETGQLEAQGITIALRPGPLAHPNLEVGHAQYNVTHEQFRQKRNLKVHIVINTGEREAPIALNSRLNHVKRLALHEIGHAIGIWGHSGNPEDIMYSHPIVSTLSERDIKTLHRLYEADDRIPRMFGKPRRSAEANPVNPSEPLYGAPLYSP